MNTRNLDLTPRNENTKSIKPVVRFELDEIKKHFMESVISIKAQFHIADELRVSGGRQESQNIYRAQIIFLESAFDFYMHELTKYGLCKIYDNDWEKTDKYKNIKVNMEAVEEALASDYDANWFLNYVNELYKPKTLVSYEAVKDQLNLLKIDIGKVADGAFYRKNSAEKTKDKMKRRLDELYDRRNYIAHQADREHTDARVLKITKQIVKDFIKDIVKIVNSIDREAGNK